MSPKLAEMAAAQGDAIDSRYHPSAAVRRQLNKVFPTHWSFLLGEIALYSFIVLLLTGTYLTLFFDPSMAEVTYHGVYQPLNGVQMSRAYETTLDITRSIADEFKSTISLYPNFWDIDIQHGLTFTFFRPKGELSIYLAISEIACPSRNA